MERRPCGNTGIEVSVLGIGAWSFGGGEDDYWGAQDQADVERVAHAALDMGVNYFDTAELYNDGRSEFALGKAVAKRRDEVVIGSKISPQNCSKEGVREHCEASLARLGTDRIDIYMVHWPIVDHPVDEAFEALTTMQQEGKIRSIGVSNFGPMQLTEALATGATLGVNQLHYSMLARTIELEALPTTRRSNVGVLAYMPLAQGILTGKFATLADVPWYRMRTRQFSGEREGARHGGAGAEDEVQAVLDGLRGIADEVGEPIADIALAWVAAKPGITCVLAGVRNVDQLARNARGCSLQLTDEVIAQLDALSAPVMEKLGTNLDYWENEENSRSR